MFVGQKSWDQRACNNVANLVMFFVPTFFAFPTAALLVTKAD